jgi:predicted  nucleic acid-binding Zn-ribbon protein
MNEHKNTRQYMKEVINKDIEILKNNQSEMNNSVSQIQISFKSIGNRVEQVENRVSGTADKKEELELIVKDHEKCYENINKTCKTSCIP